MLLKNYNILLKKYGPQGWWPVSQNGNPQYTGGPRNEKQKLEVILGTILTQNTSWKNAEKALINLNKEKMINIKKIKEIPIKELEKIIRPSVFFRQKADILKRTFFLLEKERTYTKKENIYKNITREKLLEVKGIGPETADSILLYAFQRPEFVVDAYTKRIFSRLGLIRTDKYEEVKKFFEENLKKKINQNSNHLSEVTIYNEYHALIVEHAKRFCKKNPECDQCPLKEKCLYGRNNTF